MKRLMLNLTVFSIFLVLLILLPTSQNFVLAEENMAKEECFVDLDGDGFNDSVDDIDNNDLNDNDTKSESNLNLESLISFDFGADSNNSAPLYNYEKFKLRKYSVRALTGNRGESDAGFGGNSGGVGGSGQSGGCAGGVCGVSN